MSFQKETLHGVRVRDAETEREREMGETDPEGRREQCDKTWLSLAVGNYLHTNATPGNPSGSMEKDEDEKNMKKKKRRDSNLRYYWFQD